MKIAKKQLGLLIALGDWRNQFYQYLQNLHNEVLIDLSRFGLSTDDLSSGMDPDLFLIVSATVNRKDYKPLEEYMCREISYSFVERGFPEPIYNLWSDNENCSFTSKLYLSSLKTRAISGGGSNPFENYLEKIMKEV